MARRYYGCKPIGIYSLVLSLSGITTLVLSGSLALTLVLRPCLLHLIIVIAPLAPSLAMASGIMPVLSPQVSWLSTWSWLAVIPVLLCSIPSQPAS